MDLDTTLRFFEAGIFRLIPLSHKNYMELLFNFQIKSTIHSTLNNSIIYYLLFLILNFCSIEPIKANLCSSINRHFVLNYYCACDLSHFDRRHRIAFLFTFYKSADGGELEKWKF